VDKNRIGGDCGVMVYMLASCMVDCYFETGSGQTKDYEIGICYFSTKHTTWIRSKDWLAQNMDNADCCFSELAL